MSTRYLRAASCCAVVVLLNSTWGFETACRAAESRIDFQRDIQPILAEHCTLCHGVDEGTRESGLRLDLRDSALTGGDSGEPAIVPGKPEESELLRRVMSEDDGEVMPPVDAGERLTADQIELLTRWIEQGAEYEAHWSFVAPRKAELPSTDVEHPIDAFVHGKLQTLGIAPAPAAAPHELCRRLYLDLIGLPPSPAELAAFDSEGVAMTVDRLLQSDRYGEKWARHWLDVARYSDTNGYEKDLRRDQWIWRDWVIRALNDDMSYQQFIVEQLAGDQLPDRTQDQLVATGFLRNSMINEEGAIIPEQFRIVELFDRMDCLGKSILGLTTQCAQCHSHKYDPLTMDEYYGMFAFLNDTYEAKSWVYTDQQLAKIEEVRAGISAANDRLREQRPDWDTEMETWEEQLRAQRVNWQPLVATELGSVSGLNHPTQQPDLSLLMLGHASEDMFMIAQPDLAGVTGLRLELLTHGDLPFEGPGRSSTGTWAVRELEALVRKPGSDAWEKLKLVDATADFAEPDQKAADGKGGRGPVSYLIDGSDQTLWVADRGRGRRNQPSVAVVRFETPLDMPPGSELKLVMRMSDMVGCCRFSTTTASQPAAMAVDFAAMMALDTVRGARTVAQTDAIFAAWRKTLPDAHAVNDEIESWWQQYPDALTSVLHLAQREPAKHRPTHVLERGAWDNPGKEVSPKTPAALHPLNASAEPERLRFARWLAAEESPLTARVAVNRVWQALFGVGLVETSEDFGTRAPAPEYRQLLDWLAVDFMQHGWSHKHLIRTIVTSATYQRSSLASAESMERDPGNRLLARGPRFRADAEVVRDMALSISGLITHRLGGPSVIPPVPQNVLDYNYVYPDYWKAAEGPERYRRTVYGFRKRSMPDPAMSTLDAPNGDFACARRVRSNTPLAALTGLNEAIFVEAARGLALRILREGGSDDGSRINYAYRLCVAREPNDTERELVMQLLRSQRQRIAEGWLDPRALATGDASRLPELPPETTPQDAAAWMIAARVLLNMDETITKN